MTTAAVPAFGTRLRWNDADVLELTSISGPTQTMDPIDVTSHDSPDRFREFVAGLRNGGDVSVEGNFIRGNATGQIAMHTDYQAGTRRAWVIRMPGWAAGVPQISGFGFITAFSMGYPFEDKISVSITIKVTGRPILAV